MFNSMKMFLALRSYLVFSSFVDCHSTSKLLVNLHCTLGLGWRGGSFIQSRTWACSGSGPGNVEVGHSWGEGVGVSFSPPSLRLAAPGTKPVLSFLWASYHCPTAGRKKGDKTRLIFSPSFSEFCCAKCLKLYKLNLEILLIKNLFVQTVCLFDYWKKKIVEVNPKSIQPWWALFFFFKRIAMSEL